MNYPIHLSTKVAVAGSVLLGLASALINPTARAAAPFAATRAPGYYRMMLGDFEVTALCDGAISLPVDKLLIGITPSNLQRALKESFLNNPVSTSVNGYLINTGLKLVLVDTGTGSLMGPALGHLVSNLKASGYQPEQVDEIYITHMHGDHVGGLMAGAERAFANATVRADQHDADVWLDQAHMDAAEPDAKDGYRNAMAAINPYIAAGKFKPFEGDTELVPGVSAVASHGHTPGHTSYVVKSKGQKLVLWGDLMHVAAVQFADPAVTVRFDSDPKAAALQRKRAYAEAAQQGYWVGAAHLSFPGLGHLRADRQAYQWVAANYSP